MDVAACQLVSGALSGFVVCPVGSARRALERLVTERFAAAIVEAIVSDGDGRDLCATVRGRGLTLPILMLSGPGPASDVVRGLDAGADDYVTTWSSRSGPPSWRCACGPGDAVTRVALSTDGAETNTVASHLCRLRRKVEPRSNSPRILMYKPAGYRLLRTETMDATIAMPQRQDSRRDSVTLDIVSRPSV